MLDKWTNHFQTRISPEAPVPVIKENTLQVELGGAGNALRHLDYLSNKMHELLTVVGEDEAGFQLQEITQESKSIIHYILDSSRKTTVKNRFYIDQHLIFRKDEEDMHDISSVIENRIIDFVRNNIHRFSVILLSDYAKGILTESLVNEIRTLGNQSRIPIVVDPGYGRINRYAGCTVIKPNLSEWNAYIESMENEARAFEFLFSAGTQFVLITQGADGVRLVSESVDIQQSPGGQVDVVDVTGAGDSLAAALSLIVGEGHSIAESLEVLNFVGSNTVMHAKTNL
jgi:D-beta-D-heptose 7-phosphate kinase/D-beta-D-heptose 1-phosphate adenosyltransferase